MVQLATIGIGYYGFRRFDRLFGGIAQPFKIGNDLFKDRTLGFDEMMHLQGGYRITQAIAGLYRWIGVSPAASDWIAAGISATVMTSLEYIDGRRLDDEASFSDLTAICWALAWLCSNRGFEFFATSISGSVICRPSILSAGAQSCAMIA